MSMLSTLCIMGKLEWHGPFESSCILMSTRRVEKIGVKYTLDSDITYTLVYWLQRSDSVTIALYLSMGF